MLAPQVLSWPGQWSVHPIPPDPQLTVQLAFPWQSKLQPP
jgi:hypothetical protein